MLVNKLTFHIKLKLAYVKRLGDDIAVGRIDS